MGWGGPRMGAHSLQLPFLPRASVRFTFGFGTKRTGQRMPLLDEPKSRCLPRSVHVIGVFSTLWGLLACAEWILVPILYPESKQFIPYGIRFMGQLLLLHAGCFVFCIVSVVMARECRRWTVLLYAFIPFSYLAYHVARVAASIYLYHSR